MRLGAHDLRNGLFVAPMAGVTDRPFRMLCKSFGAGLAVSEMVSSRPRAARDAQVAPARRPCRRAGAGFGADRRIRPAMMAEAARYNVDHGAQIIDINMGCPAKKVCNVAAGSALLEDERWSADLDAVVAP
jgi:tRNA-dihydrouridine synthase B